MGLFDRRCTNNSAEVRILRAGSVVGRHLMAAVDRHLVFVNALQVILRHEGSVSHPVLAPALAVAIAVKSNVRSAPPINTLYFLPQACGTYE